MDFKRRQTSLKSMSIRQSTLYQKLLSQKEVEQPFVESPPRVQQHKKFKYLLCCDPHSLQIYTMNLINYDVHIEINVPQRYRQQMEEDIKQIQTIVALPSSEWQYRTYAAWAYRRRKINQYLIRKIINPQPTYLAQSPMSDAFSNVSSLKLLVDISEYIQLDETQQDATQFKGLNPITLEFHIDLVTCADEVVKKILREIYKLFGVRLKPQKQDHKFILQIHGLREYLAGNYPILSYDRVRTNLRGIQFLQVILTELPQIKEDNFPPIFERDREEVLKGIYSVVPWEKFMDVPTFLYYPPYPLPKYNSLLQPPLSSRHSSYHQPNFGGIQKDEAQIQLKAELGQSQFIEENRASLSPPKKQSSNYIKYSPQQLTATPSKSLKNEDYEKSLREIQKRNETEFTTLKPRVLIKQKAVDFNQLRMQTIESGKLTFENYTLYSGECDFPFRVSIIGLTHIFRIFILDDKEHPELKDNPKRRATYNGLCPPRFLTKASAQQEEQHNTSKKKVKQEDDPQVKVKKKRFLKLAKVINKRTEELSLNPHINHGSNESVHIQQLSERYELNFAPYLVSVEVSLMYGQTLLTSYSMTQTRKVPFRKMIRWDQTLQFNGMKVSQLPMEVRLCMNIVVKSAENQEQVIGCAVMDVFDPNGRLRQGRTSINVWPFYKFDNRLACMGEYNGVPIKQDEEDYYSKLILTLDSFEAPMLWSLRNPQIMSKLGFYKNPRCKQQQNNKDEQDQKQKQQISYDRTPEWKEVPNISELARLQELLALDPLNRVNFTDEDKFILIKCRSYYKSMGKYFAVFLTSINWSDPEQIAEVYTLMRQWEPLHPNEALPLLDAMISDESVRLYATERIATYKDDELVLYMLQLTQALMFEQQHFSPLGEMLLERAIMNPWVVGHEFFWQLRSQLHIQTSYERYALILEQLLMLCGQYRFELLGEVKVNDEIMLIAEAVKVINEKIRLGQMKTDLEKAAKEFGKAFQFAIDPRMACSQFVTKSSRILDSKKLPLMLLMKGIKNENQNQDIKLITVSQVPDIEKLKLLKKQKDRNSNIKLNDEFRIIYKCGDDIRQDLLTLQLIKIMDKIWLDFGIDYRMKPYRVISTLDQVGMIEAVLNSQTTSEIHKQAGALGALQKDSILEYILKYNKNNMENATENFIRSCAGYCVATYVLGIGDRHSGNIMVTEMGHLFHIDFGHFLGNFKTKYGFKRERTPFVFTQEMAFVFESGKDKNSFKRFQDFCCKAYNEVRKHGHFLINIFLMMLSAGMPELQELSDIDYLKNQLSLDLSEQEATEKFLKEIENSLKDTWRSIDNFIHNIKRK